MRSRSRTTGGRVLRTTYVCITTADYVVSAMVASQHQGWATPWCAGSPMDCATASVARVRYPLVFSDGKLAILLCIDGLAMYGSTVKGRRPDGGRRGLAVS